MYREECVAGKPAIAVIKFAIQSGCYPLLRGQAGVGKSEMLAQAAGELNRQYLVRDLSLMEPPDLLGLPRSHKGKTVYHYPDWLPTDGTGLLAFEELNRCTPYMRAPTLQLLTARCLNDYKLPQEWSLAAAINPDEDTYEVAELDHAQLSRFVEIDIKPNAHEWLVWAKNHGIHSKVCEYVQIRPRDIFAHWKSNPRAWSKVSKLLVEYDNGEIEGGPVSTSTLRRAIQGTVDPADGAAFMKFLAGEPSPLLPEEILDHYGSHRAEIKSWLQTGRIDLIEGSWHNLKLHLQSPMTYERVCQARPQMIHLADFLSDLPPDLREQAKQEFAAHGRQFPVVSPPKKHRRKGR